MPQGSILGPLLFILYINDLPHALTKSKCVIYADDTTIYYSSNSQNDLFNIINFDLEQLSDWYKANKLSLNSIKSNFVIFSKNQHPKENNLTVNINGEALTQLPSSKFLGIIIDSKLEWKEQTLACRSKLSSGLYALNSAKHILSESNLKTLYYSLMHSHLTYGLLLWGSALKKYIQPLEILLKKAVRTITKSKYNEHTLPLFNRLKMFKLEDLYQLEIYKFMYQFSNAHLPSLLSQIFIPNSDIHTHYTRHSQDPHFPKISVRQYSNSCFCMGPRLWFDLPNTIKNVNTLNSFKE